MSSYQEIILMAREDSIPRAIGFIEDIMSSMGFTSGKIMEAQLAVEEACMNIINHAYPVEKGSFKMRSSSEGSSLIVVIEDEGVPFNPDQADDPILNEDLEERSIGGLGIHLIKSFVKEMRYEFVDGKNTLTLIIEESRS